MRAGEGRLSNEGAPGDTGDGAAAAAAGVPGTGSGSAGRDLARKRAGRRRTASTDNGEATLPATALELALSTMVTARLRPGRAAGWTGDERMGIEKEEEVQKGWG